ncbi:uro-adherence factor A isoform X1 [Parasteatoda tepidariorum]|uniref:uro-adherence factor A isoform X1 n=1 Tax=Parasteatoda tepidariorum TaxID=114398 RepID=UPI001C726C67|nr:centrosome-associated protein 350 isoform X1 [Parasteatoda tepidariorum]
MFRSRESTWIGFEKAQQKIDALKEEVQLAEEKLLDCKKNLKHDTKLTRSPVTSSKNVAYLREDYRIKPESRKHFYKETVSKKFPQNEKFIHKQKFRFKKAPGRINHLNSSWATKSPENHLDQTKTAPRDALFKTDKIPRDFLVPSSDSSISSIPPYNESFSSGSTSSLLADTYREIEERLSQVMQRSEDLMQAHGILSKKKGSDISFVKSTPVEAVEETVPKSLFEPKSVALAQVENSNHEYKWVTVSNGKVPRRIRFTRDGFRKMQMMVENQKKMSEEFQRRSTSDDSVNTIKDTNSSFNGNGTTTEPKIPIMDDTKMEEEIKLPPTRKIRNVSSVPSYRGFCVPSPKLSRKRISHLNKKFSANASGNGEKDILKRASRSAINEKNYPNLETAKSSEKFNTNSDLQMENDEEKSQSSSNKVSSSVSSPSPKNEDLKKESSPQESSSSKESSQNENPTNSFVKEISLDSSTESEEEVEDDDNMKKENIKPKLIRSVKRKATKLPDQTAPSPKIRHYDVNSVRNYIKKKKEERKQRSLDEHKKMLQEAENKKERLQKLYDYQKQNIPPPTKSTSPLQVLHSNLQNESNIRESSKEAIVHSPTKENSQKNHKTPLKGINEAGNRFAHWSSIDNETFCLQDENINPSSNDILQNGDILSNRNIEHSKNSRNDSSLRKENTTKLRKPSVKSVRSVEISEAKLNSQYCQTSFDMLSPDSFSPADGQTESDSFHEKFHFEKFSFPKRPQVSTKENETLKHLMKSIEALSEPFENLIRTKKWVENIPPVPIHLEKSSFSASNEKSSDANSMPEVNAGFLIDVAKTLHSTQNTTFKEQVTDIGDTSQLLERILGRQSDAIQLSVESNLDPIKSKNLKSDDEISLIEGSLNSEDEINANENQQSSVKSASPPTSTIETGVTVLRQNPDPFNFINTFNRKPIDLPFNVEKSSSELETPSTSITSNKETTPSETGSQSSHIKENSAENSSHILSQTFYSSEFSEANGVSKVLPHSLSEKDVILSPKDANSSLRISSQNITPTTHQSLIGETIVTSQEISSKNSSPKTPMPLIEGTLNSELHSEETIEELSELSERLINQKVLSQSQSSISEAVSVAEDSVNDNSSSISVRKDAASSSHLSKKDNEAKNKASHSQLNAISNQVESSSVLDSVPTENKVPSEINEVESSRVPSVSSAGDFHIDSLDVTSSSVKSVKSGSKQTMSDPFYQTSSPISSNTQHVSPFSNVEGSLSPIQHEGAKKEKSLSTEGTVENVSVSSTSPNSVTIDFTQPVRFTLANNFTKSMKVQKQNSHEEPYFPSHIVTRVAAEAAAAALTVVVSTQRELLRMESRSPSEAHSSSQRIVSSSRKSISHRSSSHLKDSSDYAIEEEISHASTVKEISVSDKIKNSTPSEQSPISSRVSSAISEELSTNQSIKEMVQSSFSHKRKISGNMSSPSPASLSENESVSSATLISSRSDFSDVTATESVHSGDSFAQLTLDVVRRITHDEESRARDQLSLLRMQERSLVEKARDKMRLLEVLKRKLQEKGADKKKISMIKKSQKDLILRLRQERAQLRCMQEAYRSVCEKHQSVLTSKHELLSEPTSLASPILQRKNKPHSSKLASQSKSRELKSPISSSNSSILSENVQQTGTEVEEILEVPDISKSATSISSQGTVIESEVSAQSKSATSSQNNSVKAAPILSQPDSKPSSLHSHVSNHSIEQAAQGLKKIEASKRHLAKREQRLFQRRKNAEKLLQWQTKLDSAEMEVREFELKAAEMVDSNKKKTKYYVSSSSSTAVEVKDKSSMDKEVEKIYGIQSSLSGSVSSEKAISEVITNDQSDSVPEENLTAANSSGASESSVEEKVTAKDSINSSAASHSSIQEEEQIESEASLVKSVIETVESSPIEEISSSNTSPNFKSPVSKASSNSEIYSESFGSLASPKASSPLPTSSETKHTSQTLNNKKDKGFSIRSPLIPRSMKRHDSSGSDDSYTISHSETASDQSDIEGRIHALTEQLRRRRAEAEKLKREHKKKYREQLKEKELSLQKQLEAYNQYIEKTKKELESQVESVSSHSNDVSSVKPQIKWPRSDTAIDSHRLRKRASVPSDTRAFESKKIADTLSSPESKDSSISFSYKNEKDTSNKLSSNEKTKATETYDDISMKSILNDKTEQLKLTADNSSVNSEEILTDAENNNNKITLDSKDPSSSSNELFQKSHSITEKQDEIESHDSSAISVITDESIPEKDASASETESKSSYPSDSFVSDSSYSKSDNEPDSKGTEKTSSKSQKDQSSSGDEVSTAKFSEKTEEEPQEFSEKSSNSDATPRVEDEESEIEYQSEISSVSVTESVKENVEVKSSECEGSEGCSKSPSKTSDVKVALLSENQSDSILLKDVNNDSAIATFDFNQQNLEETSQSEMFVTNIVNYLYCNIFDDSIKAVLSLFHKDSILKKDTKQQFRITSLERSSYVKGDTDQGPVSEKNVEEISAHLLDMCLQDSISTILKITAKYKTSSGYENVKLKNSENYPDVKSNSITPSKSNALKNENSIFQKQNVLPEETEISIFKKEIDWFDDTFMMPQADHSQLEQQLMIQQYPFYYRKIPNKPPPPYTPPTAVFNAQAALQLALKREKAAAQNDPVAHVTKNIDFIMEHVTDLFIAAKKQGSLLTDIKDPNFNAVIEKLGLTIPCQITFLDLIFDASKEILLDLYQEIEEVPQPWLKPKRLTPKPPFPCDKDKILPVLQKEVEKTFKLLPKDQTNVWQRKRPTWSTLKLGRKKRDFVDTILISEIKDEEPDWINYDQDEVTVKFQIADSIFDQLIDDTVTTLRKLEESMNR